MALLEVKKLSVTYFTKEAKIEALKKISFSLEEGQILGIMGESGSGKTTLAFSLLNLLEPSAKKEGKILFEGKEVFSLKEKEWQDLRAKKISLIFQEPAACFDPLFSIGFQFQELINQKLHLKKPQPLILESLKMVKLKDPQRLLKRYPHQLSGGELQRIAIAMAISLQPKLLIADEPTSSLDVTTESQIILLFKELHQKLKLTLIFISHNLNLIKRLAQKTLVLYQGELKEFKPTSELFKAPAHPYTKELIKALRDLDEE